MKTTKELLAEVRLRLEREGINPSKYRVAKVLGVSEQTIGNWEAGKTMDDDSVEKVADYLGYDSSQVRIWMSWERAPSQRAKLDWEIAAKKLWGVAALLLVGVGALLVSWSTFDITPTFAQSSPIYTLCAVRLKFPKIRRRCNLH